jgi:hypothetical protein
MFKVHTLTEELAAKLQLKEGSAIALSIDALMQLSLEHLNDALNDSVVQRPTKFFNGVAEAIFLQPLLSFSNKIHNISTAPAYALIPGFAYMHLLSIATFAVPITRAMDTVVTKDSVNTLAKAIESLSLMGYIGGTSSSDPYTVLIREILNPSQSGSTYKPAITNLTGNLSSYGTSAAKQIQRIIQTSPYGKGIALAQNDAVYALELSKRSFIETALFKLMNIASSDPRFVYDYIAMLVFYLTYYDITLSEESYDASFRETRARTSGITLIEHTKASLRMAIQACAKAAFSAQAYQTLVVSLHLQEALRFFKFDEILKDNAILSQDHQVLTSNDTLNLYGGLAIKPLIEEAMAGLNGILPSTLSTHAHALFDYVRKVANAEFVLPDFLVNSTTVTGAAIFPPLPTGHLLSPGLNPRNYYSPSDIIDFAAISKYVSQANHMRSDLDMSLLYLFINRSEVLINHARKLVSFHKQIMNDIMYPTGELVPNAAVKVVPLTDDGTMDTSQIRLSSPTRKGILLTTIDRYTLGPNSKHQSLTAALTAGIRATDMRHYVEQHIGQLTDLSAVYQNMRLSFSEIHRYCWPHKIAADIPLSTAFSYAYGLLPYPYVFYSTVNSINNDWDSVNRVMSAVVTIPFSGKLTYSDNILAMYYALPDAEKRYLALAVEGMCSIWVKDGKGWNRVESGSPTVYGAYNKLFYAQNDYNGALAVQGTPHVYTHPSYPGIALVLHRYVPQPGRLMMLPWYFGKGMAMSVPYLLTGLNPITDVLDDATTAVFDDEEQGGANEYATQLQARLESFYKKFHQRISKAKENLVWYPIKEWSLMTASFPHLACRNAFLLSATSSKITRIHTSQYSYHSDRALKTIMSHYIPELHIMDASDLIRAEQSYEVVELADGSMAVKNWTLFDPGCYAPAITDFISSHVTQDETISTSNTPEEVMTQKIEPLSTAKMKDEHLIATDRGNIPQQQRMVTDVGQVQKTTSKNVEEGLITTGTTSTQQTHSSKLGVKKKGKGGVIDVPNDTFLGDQDGSNENNPGNISASGDEENDD